MDELRLQVREVDRDRGGGFEVLIFVNGSEMTAAGAGMGMDPSDLLFPANKLRPTRDPRQVAVARCGCGIYGCGATDALITAEAAVVHWDWMIDKPMKRRVTFDRERYDAEMDRFENDRLWETPEREVVRLIVPAVNDQSLKQQGFEFSWASNYHLDSHVFLATFLLNQEHQVFVQFRWADRTPQQLASHISEVLRTPPANWEAMWSGVTTEAAKTKPTMAGPAWTRYAV